MTLKLMKTCYSAGIYVPAERADKLLTDTVTQWLSIRGHSMAAAWLREYKEAREALT